MKRILFILLFLFAVGANAQFTKVFETPVFSAGKIPSLKVSLNVTYDVEETNELMSHYYTFRTGDEVKILNLESMETEFSMDLTGVIDTSYYTTYLLFYKNFYKSDKSWTCILVPYTASTGEFGLQIYNGGKLTKTDIKSASILPYVVKTKEKVFLLTRSKDAVVVYLVRNDLPQTTAIPYSSPYISALKKLSDEHETKLFNAVGQKIDASYYGTLPDYLKKTIYSK